MISLMRVVVMGAFGFIGTAVARRLTLAGHEMVALTYRPPDAPLPMSPASRDPHVVGPVDQRIG